MKNTHGFTLIELVIVILILGIMSAIAVPKFVALQDDAHQSVVDSAASSFDGAVELTRLRHLLDGSTGSIELQGNTINFRDVNGNVTDFATASTAGECANLWNNITDGMRASTIEDEAELLAIEMTTLTKSSTCNYQYNDLQVIAYDSASGSVVIN